MKIEFLLMHIILLLPLMAVCAAKAESFVCNLDLVVPDANTTDYYKPWKKSYLSEECQAIYTKRKTDPSGYKSYEDEAYAFREFVVAIEQYETKKLGKALCADEKYAFSAKDRMDFYKQVDMCSCYVISNKEQFLKCAVKKRKEMVNLINNARDKL